MLAAIPSSLFAILSGLLLGVAWLYPYSIASTLLTLISIWLFIVVVKSNRYKSIYLIGLTSHLIAFYWLYKTINEFGGYNAWISGLLFLLFIFVQGAIFLWFLYLYRNICPKIFKELHIGVATSWFVANCLFFKLFPWEYAHTLNGIPVLVQGADLFGATGVTFLTLLIFELAFAAFQTKSKKLCLIVLCLLTTTIVYGVIQTNRFSDLVNEKNLKVSLIQADIGVEEHNGVKFLTGDLAGFYRESEKSIANYNPDLLIWPESAITRELDLGIKLATQSNLLPNFTGLDFMTGILTALEKNQEKLLYNSIAVVNQKGEIQDHYHKQILMPFGEYLPFADTFPILKEMAPFIPNFSAGTAIKVIGLSNELKAAPLICYEDLIPRLSTEASRAGANLLINFTNDAWFGKTIAHEQHDLIASYRAIENRRFLLRSTSTGTTSVINPLGLRESKLASFSTGALEQEVKLLANKTLYSQINRFFCWWLIFGYVIFALTIKLVKKTLFNKTK